jgi:hypothetical protein
LYLPKLLDCVLEAFLGAGAPLVVGGQHERILFTRSFF